MITGYNTDVEYSGRIYHVQTEDKGIENPVIESLIYLGGEVLACHRTHYEPLLRTGPEPRELAARLEAQHQRMVLNVRQGRHDPEGGGSFGSGIGSPRGFEEVVLDYLARELGSENLHVVLESPARFEESAVHEVLVRARGELSALPVEDVRVSLSLLTPVEKPRLLLEGRTDSQGVLRRKISLPRLEGLSAAVVLRATLDQEMVELKWLVSPGPDQN